MTIACYLIIYYSLWKGCGRTGVVGSTDEIGRAGDTIALQLSRREVL